MKLVSYNVQYCTGRDGRVDVRRIAEEVAGADLIALQEVERYWPRTGMVDQVAALAELIPDYFWVYGPGVDLHLENSTPARNHRRQFGNMLLSRSPILASRCHLLPKYGSTGPLSLQRIAVEGTVQCAERRVRFYSLHLTHLSSETRTPQVEKLLDVHANAEFEGAPVSGDLTDMDWESGVFEQQVPTAAIMMGDFNFQPDAPEYDLMVGPVSDYGGRISNPRGFVDAWCETGNDPAAGTTSWVHGEPARLDYCFVSNELKHLIRDCRVDNDATGSDHLPLWVEIDI